MVESFNVWIFKARYMQIRTMYEFIRKKTMDRLGMKGSLCEKWISSFTPAYNEIFQTNKEIVVGCEVLFNVDTGYEIQESDDTYTHCMFGKEHMYMQGMRYFRYSMPT